MRRRVTFYWLLVIAAMALISIGLAQQVETRIIQPVIRYLWIIRGSLGSIHEAFYWVCVLLAVAVIAYLSLRSSETHIRTRHRTLDKFPGEVSALAFWIKRIRGGVYARWYVARALSDLAFEFIVENKANEDPGDALRRSGWTQSEEIITYLLTARRTTPATFSRQLEAAGVITDPGIETIVDQLERYLENPNDT
jgi:hypothetical protein